MGSSTGSNLLLTCNRAVVTSIITPQLFTEAPTSTHIYQPSEPSTGFVIYDQAVPMTEGLDDQVWKLPTDIYCRSQCFEAIFITQVQVLSQNCWFLHSRKTENISVVNTFG